MRRSILFSTLAAVLGLGIMGASTCSTTGPAARSFAAGSLVIPMDNCYQRRDGSSAPGGQNVACNGGGDDGVFRAYGLVYFLLKHGVTVYWAIDGASPKLSPTAADVAVPAPASGVVAQKLDWASGTFSNVASFPAATGITYVGGPFLIDAADADRAVAMMTSAADPAHADFDRFKTEATKASAATIIDIHKVQVAFDVKQVRPLTTTPPKIAILNVTPPAGKKTASNVMYQYAVAAGLSWPCAGNGDCAGGLGPGCDKAAVLAYLASPGGDTAIPQVCSNGLCAPNFNTGAATANDIYDVLCDGDFIPPAAGTGYADTALAKGNYKLLWIPHWDTSGTVPFGSTDPAAVPALPATTAADKLAWQLRTISSYVQAGNNVFAECLGIEALEGVTGQDNVNGQPVGIPATRFQTPAGIQKWNGTGGGTLTLQPILDPAHPNMQVGDFAFSVVSGAITTFFPRSSQTPDAAYLSGVKRLITETPATAPPSNWDVSSTIQVSGNDGPKGSVAYLGGHDYSPKVGNAPGQTGQTAGTRIVLNTLFNLGFACADPNDACSTGLLGACAQGVRKCAGGGGLQCVAPTPGAPLCDGSDADANCNGILDRYEAECQPRPACTEGAQQGCYDGPPGTQDKGLCKGGTQTCTGGVWGACVGQVLPQPEACNGKDDDCNGSVDDGNLCGPNATCTNGLCLPGSCNSETTRCPSGFTCSSVVNGTCQPLPCPASPCPAGKVCQAGACADPCAGVTCGPGSSCSGGICVAGGCAVTGCADPAAPVCLAGSCVADPCAGLSCARGTFCRLGDCVRSCSYVSCAAGQHCDLDGFCQPDCSPACGAGQTCVQGACAADRCAGVQCGASQECRGGACVDAGCSHVTCPEGTCLGGQCFGGVTISTQTMLAPARPVAPAAAAPAPASGGCGTGGGAELASFILLGAWLARRRRLPALRSVLASCAALVIVAGCGSKGGGSGGGPSVDNPDGGTPVSCGTGQTSCASVCVDLTSSDQNCGACGRACGSGFACVGASCAFATDNPFVRTVTPPAFGGSPSPALEITGQGFKPGAVVRVSGIGAPQEKPLDVVSATSARLAAGSIDLTGAALGTGELRVLNPGRYVSNGVPLSLIQALRVGSVAPASLRQDVATPQAMQLLGVGFLQGASVSLVVNGVVTPLTPVYKGPGEIDVTLPAPSGLPIGQHQLRVVNPGGSAADPAVFSIIEGSPVVTAVDVGPSTPCAVASATFSGSLTGSFLYPTSVVRVSGGSIVNSPLKTSCLFGTDALGQCVNGKLRVADDISQVSGSFAVTVWNPGSPSPLTGAAPAPISVQLSCP